ncbi:MAG TPA: acyl-ACP desaturase [Mycobacteriales bacterium]|nr:acyl-ACP desaturase [Mycobacteriales bacterium]
MDLLAELEPVVATNLDRHYSAAKEWMPHEYVPWGQGRDFTAEPWQPGQSTLSPVAQVAFEVNLLTEDNLPSYHYEIATRFGRDGAWGTWVHQWTAEEGRHAMCLRDFLLVSRGVDPVALERDRMQQMKTGYHAGGKSPAEVLAYVSFQELATRIAHRNTGRFTGDPLADKLLARVAADENLHMIFYRDLVRAALELAPDETIEAIAGEAIGFQMPGTGIRDFGRRAVQIAHAGIYDLRIHHDDVLWPLLRSWNLFELEGLSARAEQARERLAAFLRDLDAMASEIQSLRSQRRTAPPTGRAREQSDVCQGGQPTWAV